MRTPEHALIDRAVRCVVCDAPMGGCGCWTRCSCGWSFRTGEACANPMHAAEQAAGARARAIAGAVVAEMARAYPEPMRHASGGFRRTLRRTVEEQVAAALFEASGLAPTEEEKAARLDETRALIDRFRQQQAGAR